MIPGSEGPAFHACMKQHDFETRKNMRKQPGQGGFRMLFGLREHAVRSNPQVSWANPFAPDSII